ncbi:MAG: hypothetical protein A3F84_04570 [Candidatus Handelsmanbacteria bacterium RIFCSPLOWO2_12_FULL_64_10]|uniref:Carbohydrate-binding protein n=1 Tax=Handelsmanbacteria sp. (strain RIFCSPLOWO2_12_FULL_64_10) TaxID=1817868 RepID=A0A1F6D6J4_HANXR|nr:MAG: hypothetical protein A3F84_04570 [Candidatus Handelsmanbacteria bacterium RIFCSPLOWO2_12_FULL_64_10]
MLYEKNDFSFRRGTPSAAGRPAHPIWAALFAFLILAAAIPHAAKAADLQAPSVTATAPAAGATVAGTIMVRANAADTVGIAGVQFFLDGAVLGAEERYAPYEIWWNTATAADGTHTITAVARDAAGNRTTSAPVTFTVRNDTQSPSVPTGLVGTAASPTQINLSWNASTDNAGVAGYTVYLNDAVLARTTTTSFSHTGLTAGATYNYRVNAYDAVPNYSAWTAAVAVTTPLPTPAPYTGVPYSVPGTFEAENFDRGGEGVGYHDNVKGNSGGLYRTSEDVDIIVSADSAGGGYVVNNFETGEWLAYTINVAATGLYDIELRASTTFTNSAFHVEIDGQDVTGSVVVPTTGSWSAFQWAGKMGVALTAGKHVLKIVSVQQYFNLNSIRLTAAVADTQAPSVPTGLAGAAVSSSQIDLTWDPSTDNVGVTGYIVYLDNVKLATTAATSFSHTGLTAGATYNYRVSAFDAVPNHSAWTATPVAVTTPAEVPLPVDPATVQFFCTFATLPTDCGFEEQGKVAGRATTVDIGRDGGTAVRLHTEPGDDNVVGSGAMERNDLWLSETESDIFEGREQWWAHSILFPDDFAVPTWHMYVVFDFHNSGNGQANFHVNFENGVLIFRGYGGQNVNDGLYKATIGTIQKNVWYDFVYHVKWSSGPDGYFDAWVNGVKKLSHRGPTLYAGQRAYLKLANYHVPVCNPYPGCTGPASSVIHDRVVRGTTPQSVSLGLLEGVLTLVNGVLTPLQ